MAISFTSQILGGGLEEACVKDGEGLNVSSGDARRLDS